MVIPSKILRFLPYGIVLLSAWPLFYGINEMPIDIDEISAYLRAENKTIITIFTEGIVPDAHPMLTQLVLCFLLKFGATSVLHVHLVAAVIGFLALLFLFGFIQVFFNKYQSALLIFFIASGEVYAHYLHLFRPYVWSSLMLFMMFYALKKWVYDGNSHKIYFVLYVIGLWGTASTHYFACISAIIYLIFVFSGNKTYRVKILWGACIAFIFYLPQMFIFVKQISHGGLSWIAKPALNFILKNLWNGINFSLPILAILILLFLVWIYKSYKSKSFQIHPWLKWGLLSYLLLFVIAFGYSWLIGPILQHSTLIFLLFFPLLWIGVLVFTLPKKWGYLLMFSIIVIQVWELSLHRRHFFITNNQITTVLLKEIQNSNTFGVLMDNPKRTKFIKRSIPVNEERLFELKQFDAKSFYLKMKSLSLKEQNINLACIEAAPRELLTIALHFFPEILNRKDGLQGTLWYLSKNDNKSLFQEIDALPAGNDEFINFPTEKMDKNGSYHYSYSCNEEGFMVFQNQEHNIYKSARIFKEDTSFKGFLGVNLPFDIPHKEIPLSTYFFNPQKKNFEINNIKFRYVEDNNYLYSRGRYIPYTYD